MGNLLKDFLERIKKNKFRKKKIIKKLELLTKALPNQDPEWKHRI